MKKARNDWFSRLAGNAGFRRLKSELSALGSRSIPWEIRDPAPRKLDYAIACKTCRFVRTEKGRRVCQATFLKALTQTRQAGRATSFICPIQRHAFCVPVMEKDQVRGYLATCYNEQPAPLASLRLGELVLETLGRETERVDELKMLSETIEPRCIALSTIHTIHRLISSTLNLQELLPRVARLCCQVIRSQACVIWMVDQEKGILVTKAEIHLAKTPSANARPVRLGQGLIGRLAVSLKSRMEDRMMVVPLVEEECIGVLMVSRARKEKPFKILDREIVTTMAEQAVVAIRNAQMYETQERVTWGTIRSLSAIMDGMDAYSPGKGKASSTKRLADIALAIADEMKLPLAQQRSLHYAALLHDAGRVGIPEEILHKPSKLEPAEYAKVKEHAVRGASLLEPLETLEPAVPIILHHHERYDGTGYPKGLKKEAIPLGARILGVANAFEAMVSDRPYRRAMSIEEAAREISSHAGTQFDPKVVDAFLNLVKRGKIALLLKQKADGAGEA